MSTRPNISKSNSSTSTRVPHCITGAGTHRRALRRHGAHHHGVVSPLAHAAAVRELRDEQVPEPGGGVHDSAPAPAGGAGVVVALRNVQRHEVRDAARRALPTAVAGARAVCRTDAEQAAVAVTRARACERRFEAGFSPLSSCRIPQAALLSSLARLGARHRVLGARHRVSSSTPRRRPPFAIPTPLAIGMVWAPRLGGHGGRSAPRG